MRWNRWLTAASWIAVFGVVMFAWGTSIANNCHSTAFLGCLFVGLEQMMTGFGAWIIAAICALIGLWRGRDPSAPPLLPWKTRATPVSMARVSSKESASIEAEIAQIDAELSALDQQSR